MKREKQKEKKKDVAKNYMKKANAIRQVSIKSEKKNNRWSRNLSDTCFCLLTPYTKHILTKRMHKYAKIGNFSLLLYIPNSIVGFFDKLCTNLINCGFDKQMYSFKFCGYKNCSYFVRKNVFIYS